MAKTGFNDLPLETVLQIVTHIDDGMDRLCPALTCRSLLNFLDKDKSLQRSPRYRAFKNMAPPQTGKRASDRWTLLRKLEDSRWRCCFGCFKLHPAHEFSVMDLRTGSDKRNCMLGPLVGTVGLCPCMEITFRDKIKLMKLLSEESKPQDPKQEMKYNKNYTFKGFRFMTSSNEAVHKCSYLPKPTETNLLRAGLCCYMELFLEEDGNLVAKTRYKITTDERLSDYLLNHNMLICPHRRLISQAYEIQRAHNAPGRTREVTEVKVDGTWWKWSWHSITCSGCNTTICNPKWTFIKRKTANTKPLEPIFVFETRRCLGKAMEKADQIWYQQTENNMP